jgi:prophage regulatory protein
MPMVVRLTGLARSTIYRLIATNMFPGPIQPGKRAVAWRRADLDRCGQDRPRTTD